MSDLLTRKGARNLTETLDRVATAVQNRHSLLGIPARVAQDFAYRCDLLSDAIERTAVNNFPIEAAAEVDTTPAQDNDPDVKGVTEESGGTTNESPKSSDQNKPESYSGKSASDDEEEDEGQSKEASPEFAQPAKDETGESVDHGESGYDANAIADDRGGPYKQDGDESYMRGEFSQERFHQLHDKQVSGQMPGVDAKLAAVVEGDLKSLRELSAALREVVAQVPVSKMPGFSPMQLRAKIDRIVALRQEIEVMTAQYEEVLKKLKGLEKEEAAGLAELKKAAGQMREKGQYLVETERAMLQFTAYLTDKVPGIEQMIAKGEEYKGEKAGDFFGRVAAQLGAEVAESVEAIYAATKEDLTHSTMAVRGLKVVVKTSSFSAEQQKTAGVADIVVGLREWLAGGAVDNVVRRLLNFAGDIGRWVKGFFVRTKIVEKETKSLLDAIKAAQSDMDGALAASRVRTASEDNDWGFNLSE